MAIAIAMLCIGLVGSFLLLRGVVSSPQTIFDYASGKACITRLTILPAKATIKSSLSVESDFTGVTSVAGRPVFATGLCITPKSVPTENADVHLRFMPLGLAAVASNVHITFMNFPRIASVESELSSPVAINAALRLKLSGADRLFTYELAHEQKTSTCRTSNNELECPMQQLALEQGQKYTLGLERTYEGKRIETVEELVVETHKALILTPTAYAASSIVYAPLKTISFTSDRPLASGSVLVVRSSDQRPVEAKTIIDGDKLSISFTNELPRQTTYIFDVSGVVAQDGSTPAKDFRYSLSTSGGPRVLSTSLRAISNSRTPTLSIDFDQPVDLVSFQSGLVVRVAGESVAIRSVRAAGNSVMFSLDRTLGQCVTLTLELPSGVKSVHGYAAESHWSASGRTLCYTTSTLGVSRQGRAITAYHFGSGSRTIVFMAGTHGDERGTVRLVQRWADALEARPDRIPADKRIIVVPIHNPDGYAMGVRNNAQGVDLNRNYPTSDWRQSVESPYGGMLPTGGGTAPLSEPEAVALASLVNGQQPVATYMYHSRGSIVLSNDIGDSWARTLAYAKNSGYAAKSPDTVGSTFEYQISGAMDDWMREVGLTAILIELSSHSSDDYNRNIDAMWDAVQR